MRYPELRQPFIFMSEQQSRLESQHISSRLSILQRLSSHVSTSSVKGLFIQRFKGFHFQDFSCSEK